MQTLRTNPRLRGGAAILLIASIGLALAWGVTITQASHADHGPISVEILTGRAQFTDQVAGQLRVKLDGRATSVLNMRDLSRTVVAKITVPAGAHFPWHTHPGPVIVNVAAGTLVYVNAKDCVERSYAPGTAFLDPGRGNVHTAFNPSTTETTVLFATFFEVPPAPAPLTITEGVTPGNC
jgi:hypothetical protein